MSRIVSSDELLDAVRDICSRAEREVLICSAWITLDGIRQIFESLNENVNVKILMRASELRDLQITDNRVISYLNMNKSRFDVEYAFHSNLHAKFIVVDDKFALIGSANVTYSGFEPGTGNIETAVLVDNLKEIQKLREEFMKIWEAKVELGEVFVPEDSIVGFIANPSRSNSVEILLLQDADVFEGQFVVFMDGGRKYLARIDEIMGGILDSSLIHSHRVENIRYFQV